MKNRLSALAAPSVRYHHAPHNPACVGMLERFSTNKDVRSVRVMSAIMKNKEGVGGFDVITLVQYGVGADWIVLNRSWASDVRRANKIMGTQSRQCFKTAVSRSIAASLHADVYVPDTEDIDC